MFDVVSNKGCLFSVEELAYEQFFLIVVETIMEEMAKPLPIGEVKLGFDGLKPASSSFVQVLFRYTNPDSGRNSVHFKIVRAK
jgi:hypothetical protein